MKKGTGFEKYCKQMSKFVGKNVLEIGCGGGQMADRLCRMCKPEQYVAIEVRNRLFDSIRKNPPPGFIYLLVSSFDVRYNPSGDGVQIPDGPFDTVLGKSWLTHVKPEHFTVYARLFADRMSTGGWMVMSCFIDDKKHGAVEGKNHRVFYSEKWLAKVHPDLELAFVFRGGWTDKRFAPHDIVGWRKK